jgi:hypothetical protein
MSNETMTDAMLLDWLGRSLGACEGQSRQDSRELYDHIAARLREQKGEAVAHVLRIDTPQSALVGLYDDSLKAGDQLYSHPAPITPAPIAGGGDAARALLADWHRKMGFGPQVIDDCLSGNIEIPPLYVDLINAALSSTAAPAPVAGEALRTAIARAIGCGYHAGHHDTVEGNYTDVGYKDRVEFHGELADDLLSGDEDFADIAALAQDRASQPSGGGVSDSIRARLEGMPHRITGQFVLTPAEYGWLFRLASAPAAPETGKRVVYQWQIDSLRYGLRLSKETHADDQIEGALHAALAFVAPETGGENGHG